ANSQSSSFYCHGSPRDLHSFPTRRSSDLSPRKLQPLLAGQRTKHQARTSKFTSSEGICPSTTSRTTTIWRRISIRCRSSPTTTRSEEHTSELQSQSNLVCRLLLEKKKNQQ